MNKPHNYLCKKSKFTRFAIRPLFAALVILSPFAWATSPAIEGVVNTVDTSSALPQTPYQLLENYDVWQFHENRIALVQEISQLRFDGLIVEHYSIDQLRALVDKDQLSAEEFNLFSQMHIKALKDLTFGRTWQSGVEEYLVYGEHNFVTDEFERQQAILALVESSLEDLTLAYTQSRPHHPHYNLLRNEFKKLIYSDEKKQQIPEIDPVWPSVRPGDLDARVAILRQHFNLSQASLDDPFLYDADLVEAVKNYQRKHGLTTDGIAGPKTLSRLNQGYDKNIKQLRVNLERFRRLQKALEDTMVLVDITGGQLEYFNQGQLETRTNTQVGRIDRKTPLIYSKINYLTLNPTWTVPPTVFSQDKLPAIQEDLNFLTENHMRVIDYQGNTLDPEAIDWSDPGSILLRQSAGPHNALGQIVIRFPNNEAIYLHDTPSKHLFNRPQRFFSSGCVRVEAATSLAEMLLANTHTYLSDSLDNLLSQNRTRNVFLNQTIPILLAYWTADINANGEVEYREDVYQLDDALLAALDQP